MLESSLTPTHVYLQSLALSYTWNLTVILQSYLKEMQKHKVSHLVRVCDASYDVTRVAKEGIEVKDWPFVDGDAPPDSIITQWLDLVSRMSESKGVSDLFRFFIQSCSCCASTRRLASVMPHSGHWHSYSLRRRSRPRSGISWHRTC